MCIFIIQHWCDFLFCFCFVQFLISCQESKKHLAGLGTLGLGSLITEITANEEEEDYDEESRDLGGMDAEGQGKDLNELSFVIVRLRVEWHLQRCTSSRLGEEHWRCNWLFRHQWGCWRWDKEVPSGYGDSAAQQENRCTFYVHRHNFNFCYIFFYWDEKKIGSITSRIWRF